MDVRGTTSISNHASNTPHVLSMEPIGFWSTCDPAHVDGHALQPSEVSIRSHIINNMRKMSQKLVLWDSALSLIWLSKIRYATKTSRHHAAPAGMEVAKAAYVMGHV